MTETEIVDELDLFAEDLARGHAIAEAEEYLPPSKQEFHVTDENSANWVLGKLLDCAEEEARIKAWYKSVMAEVARRRDFFEGRFGPELEAFATQALADSDRKSLKLPNGNIGFRATSPGLVIRDEAALIGWAEDHAPGILKVTKEVSKTALKEVHLLNGEIPPGTEMVCDGDKFYYAKPRGTK